MSGAFVTLETGSSLVISKSTPEREGEFRKGIFVCFLTADFFSPAKEMEYNDCYYSSLPLFAEHNDLLP